MRTLIRWATRLYPRSWRDRYGPEFDALLGDIHPSWRDLFNVVGLALATRGNDVMGGVLTTAAVPPRALSIRLPAAVSLATHLTVLTVVIVASRIYISPIALSMPAAPQPPPAPHPPAELTDPRVFPMMYSSLPFALAGNYEIASTHVVEGVGIYFPILADAGTIDRRRNPLRRVWPGDALESNIFRRVLPKFPPGVVEQGAVSIVAEYLIGTNGSVTVIRISGPVLFANAARSALEAWLYRPMRFENHAVEIVSRVEVRFDSSLANAAR